MTLPPSRAGSAASLSCTASDFASTIGTPPQLSMTVSSFGARNTMTLPEQTTLCICCPVFIFRTPSLEYRNLVWLTPADAVTMWSAREQPMNQHPPHRAGDATEVDDGPRC